MYEVFDIVIQFLYKLADIYEGYELRIYRACPRTKRVLMFPFESTSTKRSV